MKGLRKTLVPAKSVRRRLAAMGAPMLAHVEAMPFPLRVSENAVAGNRPGAGNVSESRAVVLSAANLVAADEARRLSPADPLRAEHDNVGIATPVAESDGSGFAAVRAPGETPVKAMVSVPGAVEGFVLGGSGLRGGEHGHHADEHHPEKTGRLHGSETVDDHDRPPGRR